MFFDRPHILAKYLALRMPPGTPVRYFGSIHDKHGHYIADPCGCSGCTRNVLNGTPGTRYALLLQDGRPSGIRHVRHTSVIPHTGARENVTASEWLPDSVTEVHLTRQLRKEFPGTDILAYMKGSRMHIRWKGGPDETEVRTVSAPILATYAKTPSDVPWPITVAVIGRAFHGIPRVSKIEAIRLPEFT